MCLVGSALWRNTNGYCFRSMLSVSNIRSQLVLLSGASHMLTVSALCTVCVTYVHSWFCLSGTTPMLTVSLSILLESHTFLVASALWHNPNAYCFALYTVCVTYMPCQFCCLVQHMCVTIISCCGIRMEACSCLSLPLLHSPLSGIVYVLVCFNVFTLS